MASKYGLPTGVRMTWRKGERPTGRYRSFFPRGSWELVLVQKGSGYVDETPVVWVTQQADGSWKGGIKGKGQAPNMRLIKTFATEDEAKGALDDWIVRHPEQWKQFIAGEQ